ncbi:MAG TPA: hydantoinase B/oxoprolinase family protein [Trebonia sp.]
MSERPAAAADPITAEIIRASLVAITTEMKSNLMRTAYNLIIYESQDFTVGLFDAAGRTVSIGLGLPMFVQGLADAVRTQLDFYGADGIQPGDILLTNDPYIMGSHLNHMIFTLPIFCEGEIVAFASSMAHWMDVGGVLGGTTEDIYSEGIQIPIVKIYKRGVQDDEITRIIANNVRFPELAMGDMRAQVSAIRTGESRMTALFDRYGKDVVRSCIDDMYVRSEEIARRAVADIPDGRYEAEAFMDDDGVNIGVPVPIKVAVEVAGDAMTIDLSEVSPQVAGYFNSGATAGRSAAQVAFKCITSPTLFPINDGSLRPVNVVLPPGLVISARKPAAMRWWMTYPMTVIDCVFRALADVTPSAAIAGHHADLAVVNYYGLDRRTGRFFMAGGGLSGGGWGATERADGVSATVCVNDGDTHNQPVEAMEAKHPAVAEEYSLRADSGGPGRFRGGLGTTRSIRVLTDAKMNSFIERTKCAPWGVAGGADGLPNRLHLRRADGEEVDFPNGKVDGLRLGAGDRYVVQTGGGGGYGDPRTRPADMVLADVRAGYVSRARAEADYGVVVIPGDRPGQWRVDEEATRALRG